MFPQLEFFTDGRDFFGYVQIVDDTFFYVVLGQVVFLRVDIFADSFLLFLKVFDDFVCFSVANTAVFFHKFVHQEAYRDVGYAGIAGSIADVQLITREPSLHFDVFQSVVAIERVIVVEHFIDVVTFFRTHICFLIGNCFIFARFVDQL